MKNIAVVLFTWLAVVTAPAFAAGSGMGIAAVVGGDAISSYDVDNRIRFVITTAHLSDTPDMVARIRPQVIRALIDERLQLQEAGKNGITISDEDVSHAVASIEEQRGMEPGAIAGMLRDHHVPEDTFIQQIRAQLAWNKLLIKKVRPLVRVSDEEIDLARKKFAAAPPSSRRPEELKIAVIVLPVDKRAHEGEVRRLAQKLVSEVRRGASFEEAARQFSSSAAAAGGRVDAFWVRPSQLDPAIARALVSAQKGSLTDPVRTDAGFTIVKVYDMRVTAKEEEKDSEVTLKEILLKLKPEASDKEANVLLDIGEEVAKHPGTCGDKNVAGIENLNDVDITVRFRHELLSALPSALKVIAGSLKVGDISTPFASDEGLRLYMLCDRKDVTGALPDRERIGNLLLQQKMELEAQKYLRNLQRETFIEVRSQ